MKYCRGCAETLPESAFHVSKGGKDGLQSRCVACKKLARTTRVAGVTCKYCARSASFVSIPACYTHGIQIRAGDEPGTIRSRRKREQFLRGSEICCVDCEEWKPLDQFRYREDKEQYEALCRLCRNWRQRAANFSLSVVEVKRIVSEGCNACGSLKNVQLDHDHSCCPEQSHSCGKCVRGGLCGPCNTALGALGDSAIRLKELLEYRERVEYDQRGASYA